MSNSTYMNEVFVALNESDAWWDPTGVTFDSAERAFEELGVLAAKQNAGTLSAADARQIEKVTKYLADCMSKVALKVQAIDIPAVSADEQQLKAFIANFAKEGQKLAQNMGLVMDEIAA